MVYQRFEELIKFDQNFITIESWAWLGSNPPPIQSTRHVTSGIGSRKYLRSSKNGECMKHRFPTAVAVAFIGQHDQSGGAACAFDSGEHSFRLLWERAGVVVLCPVNEQDRLIDQISRHERRELVICFRRVPENAPFRLETERRERPVIGA